MDVYFVIVKGHDTENGIYRFYYYEDAAEFYTEIMLDKGDDGCENLECSLYKANQVL